MQVLILEDDPSFQAQLAQAMMGKGFNVLCVETVPAAEAFLRLDMADVLIAGERIGGRLSHPVALLAECRNPLVAAVLLTDRTGPDLDELFDLLPSLVGVLGRRVAPSVVTQVVMAAVADMSSDTVRGRLAARWAAADRTDGPLPSDHPPLARMHVSSTPDPTGPDPDVSLGEDVVPADPASDRSPSADTAHGWDRLWQNEIAALVAPRPDVPAIAAPAPVESAAPPATEEQTSASLRRANAAQPAAAPAVAPPARTFRPSPDSPLARVMAAGSRAVARPTRLADSHATISRDHSVSDWLAPTRAAQHGLVRTESGAPAMPVPSLPPHAIPVPVAVPARRLHLT